VLYKELYKQVVLYKRVVLDKPLVLDKVLDKLLVLDKVLDKQLVLDKLLAGRCCKESGRSSAGNHIHWRDRSDPFCPTSLTLLAPPTM
jgi:hypothetical protein